MYSLQGSNVRHLICEGEVSFPRTVVLWEGKGRGLLIHGSLLLPFICLRSCHISSKDMPQAQL